MTIPHPVKYQMIYGPALREVVVFSVPYEALPQKLPAGVFFYFPLLRKQQGGYLQATPVYCRPRPVHTYTQGLCQIL